MMTLPSLLIVMSMMVAFKEADVVKELQELVRDDFSQSQIWNLMTMSLVILIGFRTRQALGRFWEGTSLLHQMRGEWFDSVSCLMSFSKAAKEKKPLEVFNFRQTLVRLTSLMHASALDEICGHHETSQVAIDPEGLDMTTLGFLHDCSHLYNFNRVEAIQHMIQVLVTHNQGNGVLTIPPPILSRIYQTLSRGLVNLLNAKKITDTQFPFPWAQLITLMLTFHCMSTPLVVVAKCTQYAWALLLTFVPVFGMIALNLVAAELEMPFGLDANDLPLAHFQLDMNRALLLLCHDLSDHLVSIQSTAQTDFQDLMVYTDDSHANSMPLRRHPAGKGKLSFAATKSIVKESSKESSKNGLKNSPAAVAPPASAPVATAAVIPAAAPAAPAAPAAAPAAEAGVTPAALARLQADMETIISLLGAVVQNTQGLHGTTLPNPGIPSCLRPSNWQPIPGSK